MFVRRRMSELMTESRLLLQHLVAAKTFAISVDFFGILQKETTFNSL